MMKPEIYGKLIKRTFRIVEERSGASIIFVLAVMLLLLAAASAVLTAASYNDGVYKNRRILTQLNLYADSVQKTVFSSLKSFSATGDSTLGTLLVLGIYDDPNQTLAFKVLFDDSDIELPDITVAVKVEDLNLIVSPAEPEQYEVLDDDNAILIPHKPRKPQSATLSGLVTVTVEIPDYLGKSLKTVAKYGLLNAYLEDGGEGDETSMYVHSVGVWSFISYGKAEIEDS